MPESRLRYRRRERDVLPTAAQLAKKLATDIIPATVHRRRDLRREAAGFVFQRTRSLAPEKPELPQVRRLEIRPVRYQRPARSRRWPERRRDLPSPTSCMAVGGAQRGTTRGQRHRECHAEHRLQVLQLRQKEIARVHALRSQGHDRSDALPGWQSIAPIRGATIEPIRSAIWRNGCFKPTQTRSRRACQLLLARLFEQETEAVFFKVRGWQRVRGRIDHMARE